MLLTPEQLADMRGVSPQTVTSWCRAGLIDGANLINGHWIIQWSPLMAASLPMERSRGKDGTLEPPTPKRGRGRPKGARNKKPYPKGVRRPRKNKEQSDQH